MSKSASNDDAIAGLSDTLADRFDTGLANAVGQRTMFELDDVDIEVQDRDQASMDDDEQSLAELGRNLRKLQLAPILLRKSRPGSAKPYLLVAGERRLRAARLERLSPIWGDYLGDISNEEAADAQFAENIQRRNLTQFEEAKRIQRDLDSLGSVDAVLAKHNKSRAWLSKIIALLHLPEQAKRLVKENISADLEVINTVKTIEKADPVKARQLVDILKQSRGRSNARDVAAQVKDEVKPPKKPKKDSGGQAATARNRTHEESGGAATVGPAKSSSSSIPAHLALLARAYDAIFEGGRPAASVLDAMSESERDTVESFLHIFYETGKQSENAGRVVMEGFRNGGFATDGCGAFALVAYLQGTDGNAEFSSLNILGCVEP